MAERFISEPIVPTPGTFDVRAMTRGEPGLPARFTWRGDEYEVADVLTVWTTSTPEGGSGEVYLRRHWWEIQNHGWTSDEDLLRTAEETQQSESAMVPLHDRHKRLMFSRDPHGSASVS